MTRITQKMLDNAIARLQAESNFKIVTNDCYGYSQLAAQYPNSTAERDLASSLGDSKKDLYYQIHFLLDWLSIQNDPTFHQVVKPA